MLSKYQDMVRYIPWAPCGHIYCDGKQINLNAFAVDSPHKDRGLRKLCRIQSQDGRLCYFTMYCLCCVAAGITVQTFYIHHPQCHCYNTVCVSDGRNRKSGKHTKAPPPHTHTLYKLHIRTNTLRCCCLSATVCDSVCKPHWSVGDLNTALHLHNPPAEWDKTKIRRYRERENNNVSSPYKCSLTHLMSHLCNSLKQCFSFWRKHQTYAKNSVKSFR